MNRTIFKYYNITQYIITILNKIKDEISHNLL